MIRFQKIEFNEALCLEKWTLYVFLRVDEQNIFDEALFCVGKQKEL